MPAEKQEVEAAIRTAIEEAKQSRADLTYYIPCRLMKIKHPPSFGIGPVNFYSSEAFDEKATLLYEDYLRRGEREGQKDICETLADRAKNYYEGFTWVAEVKVLQCDPATSKERASLAVRAAVDILHLLFGAESTGRMAIGGPRLPDDPRSQLTVNAQGELDISYSHSATSEVGFGDDLGAFFVRDDVASLVDAARKAIEPLVDPRVQRPLGLRVTEALVWFGDAAREETDAARIVKATNALERLLATMERENGGVTKAFSRRGAALSYNGLSETFEQLAGQFSDLYELRSRLAHGFVSPFDPEVMERAPAVMHLARRTLCCALGLFEERQLFDRYQSDAELPKWLDALVEETRAATSNPIPMTIMEL